MRNALNCANGMIMYEFHDYTMWERYKIRRENNKLLNDIMGPDYTLRILGIILAVIFILAGICLYCVDTAYAESDILYVCVNEGSHLNGRARPSKHADITMKLYKGDAVEVIEAVDDGWLKIVGGETGISYIDSRYVSESLESFYATNISGGRVRVRDYIDGRTVAYIKAGGKVKVERTMLGWGYIGSGWIMLDYFEY